MPSVHCHRIGIDGGDADVDPYPRHTQLSVLEFGATYGSGGIGTLVQPLIVELVIGTLKPNRLA